MKTHFAAWILLAGLLATTSCGRQDSTTPPTDASAASPTAAPVSAGEPIPVTTASGIAMVALPGGEFVMGSDKGNPDEAPAHRVRVSPFLIDVYEVTHDQYLKAQLPNPSHWQDNASKPVERVRWRDAKQYCNERSALEGLKPCYNEKTPDWDCDFSANGYRLPTEAEWEFACRAGTTGDYDFGTADKLRQHAWYAENSESATHLVGRKKPNRWGIHDLYGNVSEWCEDVYAPDYYAHSAAVDPTGPPSPGKDVLRVMRGGSWRSTAAMARASVRQGQRTGNSDACFFTDYCGFRCVRRASPDEIRRLATAGK